MSDFASAAMGRALIEGMRLLGMSVAIDQLTSSRATIPLDAKRLLLQSAVTQGGITALLKLGQGIKHLASETAYQALCSATCVDDLLQRWSKLECYLHSRHRIQVLESHPQKMTVRHFALPNFPEPYVEEDLVVLGVLAALIEEIGAQNLRVYLGDLEVFPTCNSNDLKRTISLNSSSTWTFVWDAMNPNAANLSKLNKPLSNFMPLPNWQELTQKIAAYLASNLIKPPALSELASLHGFSSRGLQRKLADEGLTFSKLVSLIRSQLASHALLRSNQSIAEIGFVTGYADQPHFTRDFKKTVGLTPAKFRESFTLSQRYPLNFNSTF